MNDLTLEQARDIIVTALEHASSYTGVSTHHNSKRPLTWDGQVNYKLGNTVEKQTELFFLTGLLSIDST